MGEPTLLTTGTVQVTRQRLVVQDRSYLLREITAVYIGTAPLPRSLVLLGLLLGIGISIGAQAAGNLGLSLGGLIVLAAVGGFWWYRRHTYTLVLGTSAGDQQVLVSRDRAFIDRVAQAIDLVLVERSRSGR
jgi:hypothetical protein